MEESINKFVQFIYFLIDLIKDLVVSVSGKKTNTAPAADSDTDATNS